MLPCATVSSRFFERAAHRFVRNCFDELEFNEFVGQQLHRPLLAIIRWRAASPSNQGCLGFTIQFGLSAWSWAFGQGSFDTAFDKALTNAFHCSGANVERLSDAVISGFRICLKQNMRTGEF